MPEHHLDVEGIAFDWNTDESLFAEADGAAAVFWIDSTLRALFDAIRALAEESYPTIVSAWGRRTGIPVARQLRSLGALGVESEARERLLALYRTAGWGVTEITQVNPATRDVRMRIRSSWEWRLKHAMGDGGECRFLPSHWAGVWSGYFDAPCIAEEVRCQSQGAEACEIRVYPAPHRTARLDDAMQAVLPAAARRELARVQGRADELQAILDQLNDAVAVLGMDGHTIVVNPVAQRLLGLHASGMSVEEYERQAEVYAPDGRPLPREGWPIARALGGEAVAGEEIVVVTPAGERVSLSASAVPLRDPAGHQWGAALVMREMGAEVRLRRQLQAERTGAERRAREQAALAAATADVVGTLDLQAQLERIARRARQLVHADFAAVAIADDEGRTRWLAMDGSVAEAWRTAVFPRGRGTAGRVIATNAPVVIEDFPNDPAYPPEEFPAHAAEGMHTALGVPLREGDVPFGAIVAGWRQREAVDEGCVQRVQTLADLTALAVVQSRLRAGAEQRARELEAANAALAASRERLSMEVTRLRQLVRLTAVVGETLDEERVVRAVLDGIADGGVPVDSAALYLYDAGHRRIRGRRARYYRRPEPFTSRAEEAERSGAVSEGAVDDVPFLAEVVGERHTVQVDDALAEPGRVPAALVEHFGVRAVLAVPLAASGELVGVLILASTAPHRFTAEERGFVETLGGAAAAAILNARLFQEQGAQREEIEAAQAQLEEQAAETEMMNTELQERNAELDAHVAEMDAVLDQMVDGVLIANQAGEFVRVNPALERIYGRPLASVPVREWIALMDLRTVEGTTLTLDELPTIRAMRERTAVTLAEWTARRPDGTVVRLAGTAAPLFDARGALFGSVLVARDVTERARLVEQVQRATQIKERFFAQMSHELRTPINAILGYSQLLTEGFGGEVAPDTRHMLERIQRSGRHLLELVNDVLDISKLEAGKIELRPEAFDLAELARDTLTSVEPQAQQKGLALTLDVPGTLRVYSDPARVRQILLNLASNAVKFTERGGVTIRAEPRAGERVALQVTDTGIGIAPGDLENVFREFVQVGPRHEGTGLGLTISRRLARLLCGELAVESTPGQGSTFTLVIPCDLRALPA